MAAHASPASVRFACDLLRGLNYTIASWEGKEGFSQIAEHLVAIRCWSGSLRAPAACYQPATLELDCRGVPDTIIPRSIRGIVRKVACDVDDRARPVYTFHLVPRLWLLSQRETTRVFYRQSVHEIIRTVLNAYGIPYQIAATRAPRTVAYCSQNQETDLNFLLRLAEDHHFYFFFRPDADSAVFVDDPAALDAAFPHHEFAWQPSCDPAHLPVEAVFAVDGEQARWLKAASAARIRFTENLSAINALRLSDQNPIPQVTPLVFSETKNNLALNPRAQPVVTIHSSIRSATVGAVFTLTGFPDPDSTAEYQIIRADHFYEDNQYHNRLRCLPRTIPYSPAPVARRPSGLDWRHIWTKPGFRLFPAAAILDAHSFPPRTDKSKALVRTSDKIISTI